MKKIILVLCVCVSSLMADDIYFKNGCKILNVRVVKFGEQELVIQKSDEKWVKIELPLVDSLSWKAMNSDKSSILENCAEFNRITKSWYDISYNPGILDTPLRTPSEKRPYIYLLPVSVIAFALAYDYYDQGRDLSDFIGQLEHDYVGNSETDLKAQMNQKYIISGILVVAGLVNTYFAIKPIEIVAKDNMMGITYHF